MEDVKTNVADIQHQLDQVTPQMHPGDYSDTLANIAYYLRLEAERLAKETGNDTAIALIRQELLQTLPHQLN